MPDIATTDPPLDATPAEVLQGALIDSRQRWRELVDLAADFAFETDEWGRFTLIAPDPALEWPADHLVGRASATLLVERGGAVFDPFRVSAKVRHREAWLKRGDGRIACLSFCATPIRDASGRIAGARGVGVDLTEFDRQAAQSAAAERRAEVVDQVMRCIAREVIPSRMLGTAVEALVDAMGAEGVGVMYAATPSTEARLAYRAGNGAEVAMELARRAIQLDEAGPTQTVSSDGHSFLIASCRPRSGEDARLLAWRHPDARAWDDDDSRLIDSVAKLVRMVLEREAIQLEITRQARTDPLTGLLNRRAFLEEMERHAARQERQDEPGTLMFADLDHFKPVNDRLGHDAGDEVLRRTATLLRKTFRPTDLIARLGGDEFAIWLDGADHMTAAERAEFLRDAVPRDLAEITGPDLPPVSMSIGIASRDPADKEPLDSLMRRADMAMYQVKRGGRGHWRVSLRKRS